MAEEGIMPLWVGGEASGPVKNYIGKRTARFVVGTSAAGWTKFDCDYLCDGTADDVEINAAITALPSTGGEIVILDGTYNITANINVNKSNVTLTGNGKATILKRMSNSVSNLLNITGNYSIIQNLSIDGNKAAYTSNSHSIYLGSGSNNTVTGNTCNNNKYGIQLNGKNNTITGNICNNNNTGIYLTSSDNNTITGNTCNNNIYCIRLNSSDNNTITGNTCNNNTSYGILLNGNNSNNTVTGNTCNNNNTGIYLTSSDNNNTVTGNTCNNNTNYGIYLGPDSKNNTVIGNTCNDNNTGIYLEGGNVSYSSNNNIVVGNTCIRGTGLTTDYTSSQYTIKLNSTNNSYNLIAYNNIMGKNYVSDGGTGNTFTGNKYQ